MVMTGDPDHDRSRVRPAGEDHNATNPPRARRGPRTRKDMSLCILVDVVHAVVRDASFGVRRSVFARYRTAGGDQMALGASRRPLRCCR